MINEIRKCQGVRIFLRDFFFFVFFRNLRRRGIYSTFFSVQISQNVKDFKETINRYEELRNKAKCLICQHTSVSPITMTSCCKKILGCKSCVDRWLQERDICPHCRSTDIHLRQKYNHNKNLRDINCLTPSSWEFWLILNCKLQCLHCISKERSKSFYVVIQ